MTELRPLGELVSQLSSGVSRPFFDRAAGRPVLRSNNVKDGRIVLDDIKYWHEVDPRGANLDLVAPKPGDILVNFVNGSAKELGKAALYDGSLPHCIVTTNFFIVRFKPHAITPDFAAYFFQSDLYRKWLYVNAGFSGQGSFNKSDFSNMPFPVPPLPEQRKIAEVLRTWDEAIETCDRLIEHKQKRLGALRDSLILGRRRASGALCKWKPRRLGEVTRELTTRNTDNALGRESVMGVTKARGIVPMREATVANDIGRYKRLPPQAFAYNPMRINVGSIAMNDHGKHVLVSPDYVVFVCIPNKLNSDYLDHLRRTPWWMHYINSGGSGSVRQRTYYDDLAAIQLPLPDIAEQTAISEILNTAQADLSLTEKQLEIFYEQKRGLMQKLLTGEWRVKTDGEPAHG